VRARERVYTRALYTGLFCISSMYNLQTRSPRPAASLRPHEPNEMDWTEDRSALDTLDELQKSKRRRLSGLDDVALEPQDFTLNQADSCAICLNSINEAAWVSPCLHREFCHGA
jgi:hypothetical protein